MNQQKLFTVSHVLAAVCLTLFCITGAVIFTLHFRPLFYFDVDFLGIPQLSGMTKEDILANYNALIDYNSLFMQGELHFPTLPMSEAGRIHFEEVKNIFIGVKILFMLSLFGSVVFITRKLKQRDVLFFKLSALFTVGIPVILGSLIALNWNSFFVTFHKIFFRNEYWMFDSQTDPVINMLPDTFFMHSALLILALIVCSSIILFLAGKFLQKKLNP